MIIKSWFLQKRFSEPQKRIHLKCQRFNSILLEMSLSLFSSFRFWMTGTFKRSFVISLQPRNQKEIEKKEKKSIEWRSDQDIIGLDIKQTKLVWTNHSMELKEKDKHTKTVFGGKWIDSFEFENKFYFYLFNYVITLFNGLAMIKYTAI